MKLAIVALLVAACSSKQPPLGFWCDSFRDQLGLAAGHTDAFTSDNVAIRDSQARRLHEFLGYPELELAGHVCGAAQGDSPDEQDYRQMRLSSAANDATKLLITYDPLHGPIEAPQRAQLDGALHELTTALAEKTRTRPVLGSAAGSAHE